jgi:RNA polymerase sigma factor (sigma-70 family)
MSEKWIFDHAMLAQFRERKARQRLHDNLPEPSASDKQERFLHRLLRNALQDALDTLSPGERDLVQRLLFKSERPHKVADSLGVAQSTIHRRRTRAILKLQERLRRNPIVQAILQEE